MSAASLGSHRGAATLEDMVARFSALPAETAEPLIEAYAQQAIAAWRIDDATFWQRVKFRARLARAAARGRAST